MWIYYQIFIQESIVKTDTKRTRGVRVFGQNPFPSEREGSLQTLVAHAGKSWKEETHPFVSAVLSSPYGLKPAQPGQQSGRP